MTGRAARRYVAILREADLPIESVTGPYGGYRVGRGLRLPPLMFTAAEAVGLVMATLEGHRAAAEPTDLVGGALAKILRALPESVTRQARSVVPPPAGRETRTSPDVIGRLLEAGTAGRRVRLVYRTGRADRELDVDPWAVVLRHSTWYVLGWSHTVDAQRTLRVDRVLTVEQLPDTFAPPEGLDALAVLEEHLSQGWTHGVDVLLDAPLPVTRRWVRRSLGRLEAHADGRTRLVASTDDPAWYARQLAGQPVPFEVIGSEEVRRAVVELGRRLTRSVEAPQ